MQQKSVLVCGAWSVGTYLAIKLLQWWYNASMYGRKKLGESWSHVELDGTSVELPPKIAELSNNNHYDVIFITSKLFDVEKIVQELNEHTITADSRVSIQNGVFDNDRFPLLNEKKPVIITSRWGYSLYGDQLSTCEHKYGRPVDDSLEGKVIASMLVDIWIPAHTDNTPSLRVVKMLCNCVTNGLAAINAKTLKELFSEKLYADQVDSLLDEAYKILAAEYDVKIEALEVLRGMLYAECLKMNHYVSTYRDVIAGKENEISYLNGYIVKLGEKHNIPCPNHQKLIADLEPVVAMYQKAWNGKREA